MKIHTLALTAALALSPIVVFAETAKDIAVNGLSAVFVDRDVAAIDTYFSPDYVQHNPMFPNGTDVLKGFAANMPDNFLYEIGNVIADEETGLVAIHFRVEGFGPAPMVGVDILRVEIGLIVEHWDVLQEEVTDTVSGNPMWTPAIN